MPTARKTTLTRGEIVIASEVGSERRRVAIEKGYRNQHGFNGETEWEKDIQAAAAEMAVAKLLGLYWDGLTGPPGDSPDVGPYGVRHTTCETGKLIIRDSDGPRKYILVIGKIPNFRVIGWIESADARTHPEWKETLGSGRPPAVCVPQLFLHDLAELPELQGRISNTASTRVQPVHTRVLETEELA